MTSFLIRIFPFTLYGTLSSLLIWHVTLDAPVTSLWFGLMGNLLFTMMDYKIWEEIRADNTLTFQSILDIVFATAWSLVVIHVRVGLWFVGVVITIFQMVLGSMPRR